MTDGESDASVRSRRPSHGMDLPKFFESPKWAVIKAETRQKVMDVALSQKLIHSDLLEQEVTPFFESLGLDDSYFYTNSVQDIVCHITALYAGKLQYLGGYGEDTQVFNLRQELPDRAFFVCRSLIGAKFPPSLAIETHIDCEYLLNGFVGTSKRTHPFRVKVFRSNSSIFPDQDVKLRFFLLDLPVFPYGPQDPSVTDLDLVADKSFLSVVSGRTRETYQELVCESSCRLTPVVKVIHRGDGEYRLYIAFHSGTIHSVFHVLTTIYHQLGFYSVSKFVEQFANGIMVLSAYLRPTQPNLAEATIEGMIQRVKEDVSLFLVLPKTSLSHLCSDDHLLNTKQVNYAYVLWKFAHQFLSKYHEQYTALLDSITKNDPSRLMHLFKLKKNLRQDTFTEGRVVESLKKYCEFVNLAYTNFEERFSPEASGSSSVSFQDLEDWAVKHATSEFDLAVLHSVINFNKHILKTNWFMSDKVAFSFRLDPSFLNKDEYPVPVYGVFFVVGGEFRGFHVRFVDVARGGIRIVRSTNNQAFVKNVSTLFDENYNLALTQQRKNKDIPEGGSKGTILLSLDHQDKGKVAFRKYVNSLLDLLLPHPQVVDRCPHSEILFLGPDEGTAEYMDWASQRAKQRGAGFWKAFTTGKSLGVGGIPHDVFGMTTRGVHQYVLGVLDKMGVPESEVTKFQTGGPDGDLGSNEILISKDKTTGIVDGSGVLYDPEGIDRVELERLAAARLMVREFDASKLSSQGFRVDIEQRDVTLPDKSVIPSGLFFRNGFHLDSRVTADIFVPCGGRPESVHIGNVDCLFKDGVPRFKAIVEGANLFFTQEA